MKKLKYNTKQNSIVSMYRWTPEVMTSSLVRPCSGCCICFLLLPGRLGPIRRDAPCWEGKTLSWHSPLDVLHVRGAVVWDTSSDQTGLGFLFSIAGCICSSVTLLSFSLMSRDYPRLTSTAIMCGVTAIFSLLLEHRHWPAWEITTDIASLVPILYTGLLSTGLNIFIVAWCAGFGVRLILLPGRPSI